MALKSEIVIPWPAVKELIEAAEEATRLLPGNRAASFTRRRLDDALADCKLAAWRQGQ